MYLIIEEVYIIIKGFLKYLLIILNIYFVRNMILIFFFKGILIIICIYIYVFSCFLDFIINMVSVNSVIFLKIVWSYGNSY